MNERIRELSKRAGYTPLPGFDFANSLEEQFITNLAELIVEECGEIAYKAYWANPESVRGIHIKEQIKKHFGVK